LWADKLEPMRSHILVTLLASYVFITSFSRGARQRPEGGGSWVYASTMDLESNYEIARTAEFIHCQILKKLKKLNGNRIKKMETEERSEN
jgi:hypothetical protein